MLHKAIKYTLFLSVMMAFSACTTARTIIVKQPTTPIKNEPKVIAPTKQPVIKEEILLGNQVGIPQSNPTLGSMVGDYGDINASIEAPSKDSVIERMPFPVNEYKHVRTRGSSTVSGTVYLENSHSSLQVKGQKLKLWLNPVTSYSRQWYEESYLGGYKLSKTDKRLYNYLKFTYSDNSGKFNFFGVPTGDYYLTATMSCGQECGYSKNKSIRLVREISVGRGVTTVDLMKHVP
jgi:hypothetical protein